MCQPQVWADFHMDAYAQYLFLFHHAGLALQDKKAISYVYMGYRKILNTLTLEVWWEPMRLPLLFWNLCDLQQGKSEGFDSCDRPSNLTSNWVKLMIFLSPVNLKFDGWPWKTIGHPFYATNFVHHFIAIWQFKLELQLVAAKKSCKSLKAWKRHKRKHSGCLAALGVGVLS